MPESIANLYRASLCTTLGLPLSVKLSIADLEAIQRGGAVPTNVDAVPTLPIILGLASRYDASVLPGAQGDAINSIPDSSGAGGPTLNATLSSFPTMDIVSGKKGIKFAGTHNIRSAAATVQCLTSFLVFTQATGNVNYAGIVSGRTADSGYLDNVFIHSSPTTEFYVSGTSTLDGYRKDGVVSTSIGAVDTRHTYSARKATNNGGFLRDGINFGLDRSDGSRPLKGTIHEFISYNYVMTDAEVAQIETFLKSKWGTP